MPRKPARRSSELIAPRDAKGRGYTASVAKARGSAASDPMSVALAMLGRRSQPTARLRERITASFGAEQAERTIARLLELGVLNDLAFAEAFTRTRFERAGYGRARIRADLRARGIAGADTEAALAAVIDDARERESAERALQRFRRLRGARARGAGKDADRKLRAAAFRHLVGRGFPVDLVNELLGRRTTVLE